VITPRRSGISLPRPAACLGCLHSANAGTDAGEPKADGTRGSIRPVSKDFTPAIPRPFVGLV